MKKGNGATQNGFLSFPGLFFLDIIIILYFVHKQHLLGGTNIILVWEGKLGCDTQWKNHLFNYISNQGCIFFTSGVALVVQQHFDLLSSETLETKLPISNRNQLSN